ncbi:unnamed protein product [Mytilus coruscus]|uniref:Mitochondria-eating protein n=1 Tax=Mytilus coruscus TaxID=42192 RepID=A0A6J8A378_MYTCO|nr:unnamed protein product [Mytilus coruscus]
MNIKCDDCENTRSILYCLRCHKPQCFSCQRLHSQSFSNHIFVFNVSRVNCISPRCKIHYFGQLTSYCRDCKSLFCDACDGNIHSKHNADSISLVKDEQTEKVKKEKTAVDEQLKEIIYDIEKREILLKNFRTDLETLVNDFPYGSRYMFSLGKEMHDVKGYITWNEIECNPPLQLKILLNQMKLLKAAKYYYQEIQYAQSKVLEAFRDDECILLFHQYKCAIEKYGTNPPTCEEAPELNIFQEKTIVGETMSPLFRIHIGKKQESVTEPTREANLTNTRVVKRQEEQFTIEPNLRRTESQKKDDIVTQQDLTQKQVEEHLKKELYLKTNEAQILRETVHLMSENAKCFKAKCERMSMESVSVNFQRLPALTNYKEIEKMCIEHEQCLVSVFRILNELSTGSFGQLEKENASMKIALQASKQEKDDLQQSEQSIVQEIFSLRNELERKNKENEDLKTRLSQVAGAKLVAGNSSIADLGDKYRPTRIAELYSELYDNEWTEAVDMLLNSNRWPEDMIVRHLFIILQGCYKACGQLASQQKHDLVQKLYFDLSSAEVTQFVKQHTTELKQLMDARKTIAVNVANVISKDFDRNPTFVEYLRNYEWSDGEIVYQITKQKFFEKSISLCWLMAVQDPEMYLDSDVEQKTKFDKDHYREYTKSGPMFLYSIWPALYLHKNGPLMIKGVAQACG